MPEVEGFGVDRLRRGRVGGRELRSDVCAEHFVEGFPPLREGAIHQRLAVQVEDIEDHRHELDLLHHRVHLVLAPEPPDHVLERHGLPVADGDRFPVQNDVVVGRLQEEVRDVGEALRDVLQSPRVDPADIAHLVELEPAPVVLVLDRHLAVILNLGGDGSRLREHHLHRPERLDRHTGERVGVAPGKEGDLPEIVQRLVGMLDQADVKLERLRDGVADVPFPHPDPELLEHQPREVSPLERPGVPEEALRHAEFLPLRPLSFGGRHPLEFPVDVEEVEFLDEERCLLLPCKEPLDGETHVPGRVDRLADGLPLRPDDVGHGVVEKVRAHAEFFGAPVGKDPAHDEPDEDGELLVVEPGKNGGDLLDHIEAPGGPFKVLADLSELQKLHTHNLLKYFPAGSINPSVLPRPVRHD
ncbi:hypothetical protein DSECCO2_636380 [anaerobic digester metagenome]